MQWAFIVFHLKEWKIITEKFAVDNIDMETNFYFYRMTKYRIDLKPIFHKK